MTPQHTNTVTSSLLLWLENTVLTKGLAFNNNSGFFYAVPNVWNGLYTYALPFKPLVADSSIPNANIMTGVYLDNTFITTGQSGLMDINYRDGQVYFNVPITTPQTRISGNYAVSDFSIKLTNRPEEELVFETKHELKPKTLKTITGLAPNSTTYPVIYVKPFGGKNRPFAMGGTDQTIEFFRLIVLADNQFNLDAVSSILKDRIRTFIPLIQSTEMPFNYRGGFVTGAYDYGNFGGRSASNNSIWIENIDVSNLPRSSYSEIRDINAAVFIGLIDFEVHSYRDPRC